MTLNLSTGPIQREQRVGVSSFLTPSTLRFCRDQRLLQSPTSPVQRWTVSRRSLRSYPRGCMPAHPSTSEGLILTPSTELDAWDSASLAGAVVRQVRSGPDTTTWAMWYGGRPRNWAGADRAPPGTQGGFAGLAISKDGLSWERVKGPFPGGAVLEPNKEDWWWFDVAHLTMGDVVIMSNSLVRADSEVYFAYYSGGNRDVVQVHSMDVPGIRTSIGVAISKDGEHWSRIEGEHPSGAVLEAGPKGSFDELGVAGPSVISFPSSTDRPRYLMHYFTFDARTSEYVIGRAFSHDGLRFFRKNDSAPALKGSGRGSGAVDEKGVSRCCIVRRMDSTDSYVMFVEVVDWNGVHRIAMCESNNALYWSERKVVLDVAADPSAWDAGGVSHPSAVVVGEELWLFYTGRAKATTPTGPTSTGIGVARSNGRDWLSLKRYSRH